VTQGEINAKCVRMLDASKEEKIEFWKSLTEEQRRQASHHIETVKSIQRHYERFG